MVQPSKGAVIWGAGGHGRVVADLVRASGWTLLGFIDREASKLGQGMKPEGGCAIFAEDDFLAKIREGHLPAGIDAVVLGIGDNASRSRCLRELGEISTPVFVHPTASVGSFVELARATVVLPGAIINSGVRIGQASIINSGAVVEHDCKLGEAVHIAPGAVLSGGVTVDDRTWIGVGATVIQQIHIGRDVMVGAGAVVVRDIPDGITVVGNPARPLQ